MPITSDGSNRPATIGGDQLDEAAQQTMPAGSPAAREDALADQEFHLKRIGQAVREFHNKHGRFPPPALVAPDGTPLLS